MLFATVHCGGPWKEVFPDVRRVARAMFETPLQGLPREDSKVRTMEDHDFFMHLALEQAERAFSLNEVPVGAVLVDQEGKILSAAHQCAGPR